MAKPTDRELLRLIRKHLDVAALLSEHPGVSRADLDAFWRRYGVDEPRVVPARDLFDPPPPTGRSLRLTARCDGAARGNPGPAAVGAVLMDGDGETLQEISERIGNTTNNVAEYEAVIRAVERALMLGCTELLLLLDSDLLVNQLRGTYRVKAPHLRPLRQRAIDLLGHLERWDVRHVPRAENRAADRLANLALDGKQP